MLEPRLLVLPCCIILYVPCLGCALLRAHTTVQPLKGSTHGRPPDFNAYVSDTKIALVTQPVPVADLHRSSNFGRAFPALGPILFHVFFSEIWPNNRLAPQTFGIGAPPRRLGNPGSAAEQPFPVADLHSKILESRSTLSVQFSPFSCSFR